MDARGRQAQGLSSFKGPVLKGRRSGVQEPERARIGSTDRNPAAGHAAADLHPGRPETPEAGALDKRRVTRTYCEIV